MDSLPIESEISKIKFWPLFLGLLSVIPATIAWYAVTAGIPVLSESDEASGVFFSIYTSIIVIIWTGYQVQTYGFSFKRLFGTMSFKSSDVWGISYVIPILMSSFGAGALNLYLLEKFNFTFMWEIPEQTVVDPLWLVILGIICTVIVAPIIEEYLFRGVFISLVSKHWGVKWTLITSSVLFGILHFDPIGAILFGLVMGLLYLRTGSLFLPIVIHMVNNLVASYLIYGAPADNSPPAPFTPEELSSLLTFALGFLGISIPWLIAIIYRNWPNDWTIPYLRNSEAEPVSQTI